MKKLHPTQKQLLKLLAKLSGDGYTIRELQDSLGLSTPSLVFFHLQQLEKKGYIERNPMNPADYRVRQPPEESGLFLVNLYGLARCGPSGTILSGDVEERLELPPQFLGVNLQNPFFVRANGDSMEPRIQDGDLVLFERKQDVPDGSIVACSDNGRAFIKRLVRSGKKILLYSLNSKYEPFPADPESFHVEGLAQAVVGRI
jgi:repressor LexA